MELHETAALIQQDSPPARSTVRSQTNGPMHQIADSSQKAESANLITTQAVIEDSSVGMAETTFTYTSTLLDLDEQGSAHTMPTATALDPREAQFLAGPKHENGDSGIELVAGINGDIESK